MAIDKIVTEKELNYIETLYLYIRIEDINDFLTFPSIGKVSSEDVAPSIRYRHAMNYIYDNLLHSAEFMGFSSGRSWYDFPNYRLGIMDYELALKSNQYTMEIQYKQSHMFTLEPCLFGLDLPIPLPLTSYHIKRIDISKIFKSSIDYLTNYSYISPYRTIARFEKNGKTETVYLGNRKNGNVFRMYNKTIELNVDTKDKKIDYRKIEKLSKYFGNIEDLYTFELELHRSYLKGTFGIETLGDLEKVYKVNDEIVGKIKIYEDNDENKKHIVLKNYERINVTYITEYKEYKRLSKKRYKPSKYYAIDKAVNAVEGYVGSMGNITEAEKILMIDEIANRILEKDVDIYLQDSEYDEMQKKHNILRANQDNSLDVEAYRAFKPYPFIDLSNIF